MQYEGSSYDQPHENQAAYLIYYLTSPWFIIGAAHMDCKSDILFLVLSCIGYMN